MYDKYKAIGAFFGVSFETARKWPKERLQRAQIEYEVGAEPVIANLLAEIQRLAWVYNCGNVIGASQPLSCSVLIPTASSCAVNFYLEHSFTPEQHIFIDLDAHDAVAQLKTAKEQLEKLVYGETTHAR